MIIIKTKLLIIILLIVGLSKAQNDRRIYDVIIVGAGISGLAAADNLIDSLDQKVNCYDLKLGYDGETKLLQVINNCSPDELFPNDYVYDSSKSETMIQHFKKCSQNLKKRFHLRSGDQYYEDTNIMEIGSNSGIFIKHFNPDTTFAVGTRTGATT